MELEHLGNLNLTICSCSRVSITGCFQAYSQMQAIKNIVSQNLFRSVEVVSCSGGLFSIVCFMSSMQFGKINDKTKEHRSTGHVFQAYSSLFIMTGPPHTQVLPLLLLPVLELLDSVPQI